jgi:hypothetical protein
MKKVLLLGLVCGYIGAASAIQVKNSLALGAATNVGGLKAVNLGTFGKPYAATGPIKLGTVQVIPEPVSIKVCNAASNDSMCQGITIQPGETKEVGNLGTVYIWANYKGLMVKYQASSKGLLEFPTDFGAPTDSKTIEMMLR